MIATLLELQRLKRLDRTGWTLRGLAPGAESVAAHTYGVAVVAMLLADELTARGEVRVDIERLLRMALAHDWAETRLGDLPRTAAHYFGKETRRAAEKQAFADIVLPLSTEVAESLRAVHEDYEARQSLESRLVKAADVIDLLAQALLFERAGVRGLEEFWTGASEYDFNLEGAAADVVAEVIGELMRQREATGAGVEVSPPPA